mmetsp:Transcript_12927/g.42301  ORF Transcript_12927/g.42301 Transcript_12927/m.42301 type:complete len:206 (-) Transcript_12927:790-1407(-)
MSSECSASDGSSGCIHGRGCPPAATTRASSLASLSRASASTKSASSSAVTSAGSPASRHPARAVPNVAWSGGTPKRSRIVTTSSTASSIMPCRRIASTAALKTATDRRGLCSASEADGGARARMGSPAPATSVPPPPPPCPVSFRGGFSCSGAFCGWSGFCCCGGFCCCVRRPAASVRTAWKMSSAVSKERARLQASIATAAARP